MCHKDGNEMSIRETRTDLHVSTKAEWRRYVLDNRVKKPMKRIKRLKAINRRQQELATATRRRTVEDGRMIINNKLKYRWRRRKLKRENSWRCHEAWVDKHALKKNLFWGSDKNRELLQTSMNKPGRSCKYYRWLSRRSISSGKKVCWHTCHWLWSYEILRQSLFWSGLSISTKISCFSKTQGIFSLPSPLPFHPF